VTSLVDSAARFNFELPPSLEAGEPPEARGLARDDVRMLVARVATGSLRSSAFRDLPSLLEPGDLVVINTSGTLPAAIDAVAQDGTALVVHLSTRLDDGRWIVEPRRLVSGRSERWAGPPPSPVMHLRGGGALVLEAPYRGNRLWRASLDVGQPVLTWLETHGRPIHYGYVGRSWPIEAYQNVYATERGSAEMPSAGRPFTTEMITRLVAGGVAVAPLVLHSGVASLEADETPLPERVTVPDTTAEQVNAARRGGHRVVAIGTTVVRALETCAEPGGLARGYDGWTDLVVTPERGVVLVDGLLTGWHEPVSSHLLLLEALCGRDVLVDSYHAALVQGYRWHEFGDVHLILP
jgi:S-adenosylmethionine:tRNA ribosyltransferase-isomerase